MIHKLRFISNHGRIYIRWKESEILNEESGKRNIILYYFCYCTLLCYRRAWVYRIVDVIVLSHSLLFSVEFEQMSKGENVRLKEYYVYAAILHCDCNASDACALNICIVFLKRKYMAFV